MTCLHIVEISIYHISLHGAMDAWVREVKKDRPAGDMPDHLVREAQSVLVTACDQFFGISDGKRWASSNAILFVLYDSQCKPSEAISGMLGVLRSFEPLEAVGLILHQPLFIEACSEEELAEALASMLYAFEGTRDKVGSRDLSDASHLTVRDGLYAQSQDFAQSWHACKASKSLPCVQHVAKHVLWALSQQKLPFPVLQPVLPKLCSLLDEHMALPLANRGCRHAPALALHSSIQHAYP